MTNQNMKQKIKPIRIPKVDTTPIGEKSGDWSKGIMNWLIWGNKEGNPWKHE